MKKILSIILLTCLSLAAVAQSKPQAFKAMMQQQRLSNTIKSLSSSAQASAQINAFDTTEVIFRSFYDDPMYTPVETIVNRNGDTVVVGGDWYITLKNDRYQFIFDIYGGTPESPAGTYTEEDLDDDLFSWCMFPEANGKTHYYKTCDLTIQEEKLDESLIKYTLDAVMLVTMGVDGEEYGYFKVHAEHKIIRPRVKYDVAILNCKVTPEEDRFRIAGKNDTMDVDLTFFTETGIEGYYSHKIMDTENYKLIHRNNSYEIMELEGVVYSDANQAGGVSYVLLFEALTTDASFYNVAMEAPIIPVDTVRFNCNNMLIDDTYGMSDQTILITANNAYYELMAGYNANRITSPAVYSGGSAYVYLTDKKNGTELTSMQCTIKVSGNALKGYQVDIEMLGTDHKYYIMQLVYGVEEARSLDLNFPNSAKSYYYIDHLGLKEVQLANYNDEYSVSFDILNIDQVLEMGGDFDHYNLHMEQTFIVHHTTDAEGFPEDIAIDFAEVSGNIFQRNDSTFLTASVLGFDSCRYNISMFYAVPVPTKTVTYTFDGLANEAAVEFTNALSIGTFILDGMSDDDKAALMAKVQVDRIENKSAEGTFYNDGQFGHNDFNIAETYVQEWNSSNKEYDIFAVQKGTMTVTVENNILTAVASFICDNAVQYDLTFKTKHAKEHLVDDSEEGEVDYTYAPESEYVINEWVESDKRINLDIFAPDYSNITLLAFFADHVDSEIIIPEGVYPINSSKEPGTVYASPGVAVGGGPIRSFFCYTYPEEEEDDIYIYYYQDGLYCLVDGTVTVKKVNGKLSFEVDAVNSYDIPVKLHYTAAPTAVEDITVGNTNSSKRLINGQLFIIHNGKTYNANGALVK